MDAAVVNLVMLVTLIGIRIGLELYLRKKSK